MAIHIIHIIVIARLRLQHKVPIDPMLIARNMSEEFPIVRADTAFDTYSVQRLW